jgi:cobalt-precorrin-7 (C5)-methyltransferase
LEHQLIVVGIGPGSVDYILPEALRAIETANFLVGGARALAAYAKPHQQQVKVDADIAGLLQKIKQELAVRDVTVMVSGDPGYYSLLETFRRELPKIQIRVIPGISSFQLAFARIGLPWQTARLLSAHGRKPEPAVLAREPGVALSFLTDARQHPAVIAGWLQEQDWPSTARVWLCKNLSYPDETVVGMTLAEALNISGFESCVMVVME